jgi:flagellar basal body-associated protein FliL
MKKLINKKILIYLAIILVIAVALTTWYFIHKNKTKPEIKPEPTVLEQLQELESKSAPVTTTVEERAANLKKLEKTTNIKIKTSVEDRLKKLNQLSG